jgi:hypothetical protein
VSREGELKPSLAESFDEIDDLSTGMSIDVPHTRGA